MSVYVPPCVLSSSSDPALEIGILDIFGFEEFQRNGFEQVRQYHILLLNSSCITVEKTHQGYFCRSLRVYHFSYSRKNSVLHSGIDVTSKAALSYYHLSGYHTNMPWLLKKQKFITFLKYYRLLFVPGPDVSVCNEWIDVCAGWLTVAWFPTVLRWTERRHNDCLCVSC